MLSFPSQREGTTYEMENSPLAFVESQRDLGVIICNTLCWSAQHTAIITKAYIRLGLLKRTFGRAASVKTKKALYRSRDQH